MNLMEESGVSEVCKMWKWNTKLEAQLENYGWGEAFFMETWLPL